MKIIQINTFSYKSTGTIMFSIHKYLLDKGHDSYVVWGRGRKPENEREFSIEDKMGIAIHGVVTRLFDRTGFMSAKATRKLIQHIERIQPDIIHLHNLHGYYVNIKLLFEYIKKKNIKVVWTLHDCWPMTGHCAYFDAIGCQKWKIACYKCPQLDRYPKSLMLDNSKKNWREKKRIFSSVPIVFVTPSRWLKEIVEQSFLKNNEVKVIHNGIDLSLFKPTASLIKQKINISDKKLVLGVASEWTERKGLKDFIILDEKLPKEYQIVLVGLTPKQIKKLPTGIIGIKRTQSVMELVELYSASDVFVNPTYEDNFPTTNLEAIACGTPVITYETGGTPETISVDENGIVVQRGNVDLLVNAIVNIDKELKYKKYFCENGYDMSEMTKQYLKLYEDKM